MTIMIKISGALLALIGLLLLCLSVFSTSDTPALDALGIILFAGGIGLLVLSKILGNKQKARCNCCKCNNCVLDHDHWSH